VTADEGAEQAAAPGRIALRSPLEAFLWIFITRLIALLTATRGTGTSTGSTGGSPPVDPASGSDPDRARRVAASRPPVDAGSTAADPATVAPRSAATDATARAVAVTAAASVVAGAAAFAAGRRRGRR